MKKSLAILALLSISACSVAAFSKIVETRDDFNSLTKYELTINQLGGEGLFEATVFFNAILSRHDSGTDIFYIAIRYRHDSWLFIEDGESLILLVDGERIGLSGAGSSGNRNVITADILRERALYRVEPAQLRKIASAKDIRVRVEGSQYYVERYFTEKNFENLQSFVNRFCPPK